MENKKDKKRFLDCFRDSLGTTLTINQVAALIITVVLVVYGGGKTFIIFLLCLLFSNCIGLSIHFLIAVASHFWSINPLEKSEKGNIMLTILFFLAGMFIGSEIVFIIDNVFLGYMNIPIWSPIHFKILGVNFLIAGFFGIGGHSIVKMKKKLEQKIVENQKIKHLQTQTQLMALQSKINPHFLFNTLNTMLDLVYKSPEKVETMILYLSDIYRKVLRLPENQTITLKEETELIREYLEIEKIRMGDRLDFFISLDSMLEDFKIPPLLLEPIVENAVIHGISPKPEGGTVHIEIKKQKNMVSVQIMDNGIGFEHNQPFFGFGLQSIRERMQLIFKENANFKLKAPSSGGTCVILELPYDH
jgi:two-component system LytT family sensor kinase